MFENKILTSGGTNKFVHLLVFYNSTISSVLPSPCMNLMNQHVWMTTDLFHLGSTPNFPSFVASFRVHALYRKQQRNLLSPPSAHVILSAVSLLVNQFGFSLFPRQLLRLPRDFSDRRRVRLSALAKVVPCGLTFFFFSYSELFLH